MPNYSLGKNRTELTEWLLQSWLNDGPPVCFIEGFSGVGKTSLARDIIKGSNIKPVMIEMPDSGLDQTDNLFLNLATELSEKGINDLADAVTEGKSINQAIGTLLNKPLLVIVDEFQKAISNETGRPTDTVMSFLGRLANRPNIPGRILLLTNQIIERSKWSEAYEIKTLSGLAPSEAEELLGKLLNDTGRNNEISQERRPDIVNLLGRNPRAIHVLVSSLERSSLDELIGKNPEIWDALDREVSAELLYSLERELLKETLELLKLETATLLRRLSIHRKSIKREAIEILLPEGAKFATIRDDLINRFLMEQHSGLYSLNPVVREISLQRLKEKPSEFGLAHARAADHYMRHFKSKQIVDGGKLGGYFVEARYHLVQSQRDNELEQIAGRFENHLKAQFTSVSPIPHQLDELNERIATLTALLETPGAKGLEYYLARLYEARKAPGDIQKALVYSERSTGRQAPVGSWVLRLQLEARINGPAQIGFIAREGITRVPADKGAEQIYTVSAELLIKAGQDREAIALLKDGITKLPVDKSPVDLYMKAADLLAQTGKTDEAIALLKDGITKLPLGHFARHKLIEPFLNMLLAKQDIKAIDDFLSSIVVDPRQLALGNVYKLILTGEWESAAQLAHQEQSNLSLYRPLMQSEAFCWLCAQKPKPAEEILENLVVKNERFEPIFWLKTWVALKQNELKVAKDHLSIYLDRPVNQYELNEGFLLELWDTPPRLGSRVDLAYHFPILPSSMTGLPNDVIRIQHGPRANC